MAVLISKELMEYSLRNIVHQKTRSILTIISILIGITAIFVFISFGMGLSKYVEDFSTSGSADKISIMSKGFGGINEDFYFTENDLNAVKKAPGILEATGLYMKAAEIQQDKTKKYSFLIAYDPDKPLVMEMSNIKISEGRMLKKSDKGKVVLGANYKIKNKIMPKAYALNGKIEIQGKELQIVGFFEPVGSPQDDAQIYTTNGYIKELYNESIKGYSWIIAKADITKMDSTINSVKKALINSRNLEAGKEDFFAQSFTDMINAYTSALRGIKLFVIFIALISVLVSAINTSNTMITSVLERVKEIGVMKSVGARNSEILKIFVFEAGFLGFVAGVLGVLVGFIISSSLGLIIKTLGYGFLAPAYSWSLFLGCIVFAILTGALSGLAPAVRASRINPVQALRYE